MKTVFLIALLIILGALVVAGLAMLRDGRDGQPRTGRMARALTWRIGLSVALFLFILLSAHMGWIQPTGITVGP